MNWEPKKKKCLWLDFSWYSLYCSDLEFAPQYVWNKPVPRFCFIIFFVSSFVSGFWQLPIFFFSSYIISENTVISSLSVSDFDFCSSLVQSDHLLPLAFSFIHPFFLLWTFAPQSAWISCIMLPFLFYTHHLHSAFLTYWFLVLFLFLLSNLMSLKFITSNIFLSQILSLPGVRKLGCLWWYHDV